MSDLVAALGLLLAFEGFLFAGFPGAARRAAENMLATPESTLRVVGLVSAVIGVGIVWLARG